MKKNIKTNKTNLKEFSLILRSCQHVNTLKASVDSFGPDD